MDGDTRVFLFTRIYRSVMQPNTEKNNDVTLIKT